MPPTPTPFYNRDRERAVLSQALNSPRSELVILYGRRGVGKSALLERILADAGLAHVYYRSTRRTLPLQLEALTQAFRAAFPTEFLAQPFSSVPVFLDFIVHLAEQREAAADPAPVCVVLDELPYLADVEPGLLTTLQHWWDAHKRRTNLKLFLAGSHTSFMERQVLDANAPLYNRRTAAMKLEPMDYAEAALFFPGYSPEEKLVAFAVLGGMPSYLEQFDPCRDLETNLKATALRRNTYLSQEPDWLLLEDLRRDVTAGSVLRAVALGRRRPSDIARAIGKASAQDVSVSLANLRELGLLVREVPISELRLPRSRNSLYFIADNYIDFWYRYVDPNRSLVARGLGDQIWEEHILPTLNEYVSRPAFERTCRQYLWRALMARKLPAGLNFVDVGNWWGAGDRELDVAAVDGSGRLVLAGSCKWTNSPADVAEYASLQSHLESALGAFPPHIEPAVKQPWLAIFSRRGFTRRLRELAARQEPRRLLLVDLENLYRV